MPSKEFFNGYSALQFKTELTHVFSFHLARPCYDAERKITENKVWPIRDLSLGGLCSSLCCMYSKQSLSSKTFQFKLFPLVTNKRMKVCNKTHRRRSTISKKKTSKCLFAIAATGARNRWNEVHSAERKIERCRLDVGLRARFQSADGKNDRWYFSISKDIIFLRCSLTRFVFSSHIASSRGLSTYSLISFVHPLSWSKFRDSAFWCAFIR